MVVGDEDWPFPVPIVKAGKGWFFDTKAGRREIMLRRIGQNELDAIEICRGYVEAQHAYALKKREGYEVNQYAQRIISTEGKQDGLAWKKADGTWDGPIGEKVAAAIANGYTSRTEPYHGYFFKILKGQGPAAPLGQLDYVIMQRFRFRHPLVRRAVYESMPGGWRLGAHERCADALALRGSLATAIAHHVERSARQGDEAAIALLREAGEAAAPRAPASAARWFAAALRLLPAAAPGDRRVELLLARSEALAATGQLS